MYMASLATARSNEVSPSAAAATAGTQGSCENAQAAFAHPLYLPLMEEKGNEAWPKVKKLLAQA